MRAFLLSAFTWQDLKEIVTLSDEMLDAAREGIAESYPTEEAYYRALLSNLRRQNGIRDLPPCDERCAELTALAEEVTGHRLDLSRSAESMVIRKFVAYRATTEGYGRSEIGRAIRKDHATVLNLYQKMNDILALPNFYKEEVQMYREFERRLGGPVQCEET